MSDESFRIAELLLEGYTCSHILVKLALEAQGRDNPELVRTKHNEDTTQPAWGVWRRI